MRKRLVVNFIGATFVVVGLVSSPLTFYVDQTHGEEALFRQAVDHARELIRELHRLRQRVERVVGEDTIKLPHVPAYRTTPGAIVQYSCGLCSH